MTDFDELADDVARVEERVSDALFGAVRAQLREDEAESAHEIERRLAKVRRHLVKAEALLRGQAE